MKIVAWVAWLALMTAALWPALARDVPQVPDQTLPASARATADADIVFASRPDERRLLVLNGATASSIDIGSTPGALATTTAGDRVYVAVPDGVAVLDVTQRRVVERLPVGPVDRLALSADGRLLYTVVAGAERTSIGAVDTRTRTTLEPFVIDRGVASTAAVSSDGMVLFLGHRFYSGMTHVVDLVGGTFWRSPLLEDGVSDLAVSADGTRLYALNGTTFGGRVTVIDTATGAIVAEPSTGDDPTSIVLDPVRGRLYTANFRSESVSVIDAATLETLETINADQYPMRLAVAPGGGTLYVAHNEGPLVAIDTQSLERSPLPVPSGDTVFASVTLSPDAGAALARAAAYAGRSVRPNFLRLALLAGVLIAFVAGFITRARAVPTVAAAVAVGALWWGAAVWLGAGGDSPWVYVVHR
ncbi:MAG: YncE family protein, partial [Vicinamibacterales bacterium]